MLERLTLILSSQERQALQDVAAREMRSLREQARFIIRTELERSGLLLNQADAAIQPVDQEIQVVEDARR